MCIIHCSQWMDHMRRLQEAVWGRVLVPGRRYRALELRRRCRTLQAIARRLHVSSPGRSWHTPPGRWTNDSARRPASRSYSPAVCKSTTASSASAATRSDERPWWPVVMATRAHLSTVTLTTRRQFDPVSRSDSRNSWRTWTTTVISLIFDFRLLPLSSHSLENRPSHACPTQNYVGTGRTYYAADRLGIRLIFSTPGANTRPSPGDVVIWIIFSRFLSCSRSLVNIFTPVTHVRKTFTPMLVLRRFFYFRVRSPYRTDGRTGGRARPVMWPLRTAAQ